MLRPFNKDIDRVCRLALDSLKDDAGYMPPIVEIKAKDLCTLLSAARHCRKMTKEITNNDDRRRFV